MHIFSHRIILRSINEGGIFMGLELVKDTLKINELKGREKIETLVEAEMYLNRAKPEIDEVLWIDGKAEIMNVNIIQGKVLISGIVRLNTIYKSKEESFEVYSIETTKDFNEEIEIEDIDEEMSSDVKVSIEYIEHELVDERRVLLQALVNLDIKVEAVNSVEIIKNVEGEDTLQTLKEKIYYKETIGTNESNILIREAFELDTNMPDIEDVLKLQFDVYEEESKIVENGLMVAGTVKATFVYLGGEKLNSLEEEMAFNQFIEIPGLEKDYKYDLKLKVVYGDYELKEDIEGDLRIVDFEIEVKAIGKVYEEIEEQVIVDAYSTKKKIVLDKEEVELFQSLGDYIVREKISRRIKEKKFKEIYSIEGDPVVIDNRYMDEKIIIEGFIATTIIYLEDNSKDIKTTQEEIPFKFYIDGEDYGDSKVDIDVECTLENLNYNIEEGELDIEGSLKNNIQVTSRKKVNIIEEIDLTDEFIDRKKRPSITVYIVQRQDKLWDIAKRYNTTVENIIVSNSLSSPDNIMPGEKIIIEKHVDLDF